MTEGEWWRRKSRLVALGTAYLLILSLVVVVYVSIYSFGSIETRASSTSQVLMIFCFGMSALVIAGSALSVISTYLAVSRQHEAYETQLTSTIADLPDPDSERHMGGKAVVSGAVMLSETEGLERGSSAY